MANPWNKSVECSNFDHHKDKYAHPSKVNNSNFENSNLASFSYNINLQTGRNIFYDTLCIKLLNVFFTSFRFTVLTK